jgi:hypothetical protein
MSDLPFGHPMHPGAGTPVSMTTRVEGIPAALHLLQRIPQGIVTPTIQDTLNEIVELGIDLMAINVINTIRTDKSRGWLAQSIEGFWWKSKGRPDQPSATYEAEIGSAMPYAKYASRDIGISRINANVLIQPGKWRWIGTRGPIPGHPFLEQTLEDLHKVLPFSLNGHFSRYIGEVQREVDALERVSG